MTYEIYFCELVEDENLPGWLSGVVPPLLVRTVWYGTVQIVERVRNKVNVELIGNLILRLERSGIHDSQRVVAYLVRVCDEIVNIDKVFKK